jgi:hypothetical protein
LVRRTIAGLSLNSTSALCQIDLAELITPELAISVFCC